jgi:hypothetical protein
MRSKRGDTRKQHHHLVTTITGPQAEALRRVMGKDLSLRAKKVAGCKTVMEVYVDAKHRPFHKNPFDNDNNKKT